MKRLYHIKETLLNEIQSQLGHLDCVDTKELGEAIDMIKDLEEAIYYCTITKAMNGESGYEHWGNKEKGNHYEEEYEPKYYPRMYYDGPKDNGAKPWHAGREYPMEMHDGKEGRSPQTRRMYMDSKEMHHDKTTQIQNLEQYMKELSTDVVEMIQGSSPEEKQLLKSKLTTLISKIDHA